MTHNKGHIHTRKIIFEGFVVNPDIDFWQLNRTDKKVWSIHIRFNEHKAKQIIQQQKDNYIKFIPHQ